MAESELDPGWWKLWQNRRYVLCLLLCLGIANMYATRINLSIAIVAMTGTTEDKPEPDFDWTPQMKGFLLSSFFYTYSAMQIPAGVIVKRVSPHLMYGLAVFVSALVIALMPIAANYFYLLLVFRIVMGFFQAAAIPCIVHFMKNWAPPLERSRMQGICISGAHIGTVFSMPISGLVGEAFGWQWIFYVFALIAFIWCVIWVIFMRATPQADPFISRKELDYITDSIGENVEESKLPIPWKSILLSAPIWALVSANISWAWGFQTMLAQLPAFMEDVSGFDLAQNGLLSSLPYLTMIIMAWFGGYLADLLLLKGFTVTKVRKSFISIVLILQSVFMMIAAYIIIPSINIFCISMSVGLGAVTYAAIAVNPLDLAPPFSPILAGLGNMFGTATGIVSPILTGFIVTADKNDRDSLKAEWQIIFIISSVIYVVGSLGYWVGGSGKIQPWAKLVESNQRIIMRSDQDSKELKG